MGKVVMQVDVKTLGDKVRVARTSKRWSQEALATIAKVSQGVISRIERNLLVDEKEKEKVLKVLDIVENK